MRNLLLFFLIIFSALVAGSYNTQKFSEMTFGFFSSNSNELISEKKDNIIQSISFVGDVMLARQVETYLQKYGADYVYRNMPPLSSTTVLVGNFEAPIPKVHTKTPDLTFSFSVDAQYIPSLSDYGFSFMSLANNHTYDKGAEAFTNTQEVLLFNSIIPFGDGKTFATSSIAYVPIAETVVALVGMHTLEQLPTDIEIAALIEEAQRKSDFQIAYMHWGNEYEMIHSAQQQKLAQRLIDAGFDAVIGNHPHVVQDIEMYKGKLIIYSLGNFIFDQYFSKEVQEGLWVDISFEDGTTIYTLRGISSIGSRVSPRFMQAGENDSFLQGIAKRSAPELYEMIIQGQIRL